MNTTRRVLILLLPLLASACALQPTRQEHQPVAPAPVTERGEVDSEIRRLRAKAQMLRAAGRYAEAVQMLDHALAIRPNDSKLKQEWLTADRQWRALDQKLNDQLLVMESKTQRERLPLMEKLARANPHDEALDKQLTHLKETLKASTPGLSNCGQRQLKSNPKLARQCLKLALAEREDPTDRALYQALQAKPKAKAKKPKKTASAPKPGDEPKTSPLKLTKAREMMKSGNHFGAIRYLEKLRVKESNSIELRALLDQAKSNLERDTEKLLSAGDSLYQDGKVEEALALWQAALSLNPYNLPARKKSERALKVLANMRALKLQHEPAAHKEPM
jgi:tetratricopeptide (TPR) repeat protein